MVNVKKREYIDEKYICSECNKVFDDKNLAEKCCGRYDIDYSIIDEFEIKPVHLKLLKEMNVSWWDCEFGAPCIDPKRPYGNSDVENDIIEFAELDREKLFEYDEDDKEHEDGELTSEAIDVINDLHKQMEVVLQICLSTLSFKTGKYCKKNYNWVRIGD